MVNSPHTRIQIYWQVWEGHFDNINALFAIKVVELLCSFDVECQKQFCNEFEVYLTLEMAYQSRQPCDCITPHCHEALEGDGIHVLILELYGGTLDDWDELHISEW